MGVYFNNRRTDVFKNKRKISEPNQALTRRSFEQGKSQKQHLKQLNQQLDELKYNHGTQINEIITTLTEKNEYFQKMLEDDVLLKEGMIEKINHLSSCLEEVTQKLEKHEEAAQRLSRQMDEQLEMQKETATKISQQEDFHGSVLTRLDNQEALSEKILRQVNHIRSILFERTNYLAAKIDDGYKLTSSYVYKLMTGSDQPLTFFMLNHKKEEEQQK